MKFDIRDRKPKLWNVLIQAGAVVLILLLMVQDGAHKYTMGISLLVDVFLLAMLVQLVIAFFSQIQYNPYSYNTIYYMGFSLFILSAFFMEIYVTIMLIRHPQEYGAYEVLCTVLHSARNYMVISLPFILSFSVALCTSNLLLIRHEGKRFVNLAGILLSFLLAAGELFIFHFHHLMDLKPHADRMFELFLNLAAGGYLYVECMLLGSIAAGAIAALHEPLPDKDFVIILGCGLMPDGTPTPLLKGRIERALAFERRQKALTGKEVMFITSGGKGADEVVSESSAMKKYLMENGIAESRIVEEDRSTNTFENMKYSKEKIQAIRPDGKTAFSTTNYHVFRSGTYARLVKMRAVGMGAKTKWYFWPNAAVREFVSLLTEHRGKQMMVFGGMLAGYVILTLLAYH